jgi:murein DD-endopeptidase MepM/ murein hydrolase activator NlpD
MFSIGNDTVINQLLTAGWQSLRSMIRSHRLWSMTALSGLTVCLLIASQTWVGATAFGSNWQNASFPVENFQAYTSAFGYRDAPLSGATQFHRGLDMAAPEGSYIRNWWAGKVVEVSDNTACGTSVIVESGQWEHIYCHMQGQVERDASGRLFLIDRGGGVQIWEGQTVPAGSRIGRVGMTGRTTGPHLHWGLKYAGQWVDPALVLRAMYAQQGAGSQQQISSR